MAASPLLAEVLAQRLGGAPIVVGRPASALGADWATELELALPALRTMAEQYDELLRARRIPVAASSRCAVALATLPVVARHRPDAVVVWFDAHADLNTPATTTTGYLGGLALSGPLGLWDSGLGGGLATERAVLVGVRDADPPEQRLLDDGTIAAVPVAPDMAAHLRQVVAGRPVYVHIDCDVLEPGLVPTDYTVARGLSLDLMHACADVLAESEVVGLEVGELETPIDPGSADDAHGPARTVVGALEPLLARIGSADR